MRDLRTAGVVVGGGLLAYVLYRIASTPASSEVSKQAAPTGARGLFDFLLRGGDSSSLADSGKYTVTPGKWLSTLMLAPVNMMPKKGSRYMAVATAPNFMGYVVVEGALVSDSTSNSSPMELKIDRVVSVGAGDQIPAVPFTLQIPASTSSIESQFMEPTKWESIHPSSVSEEARASSVKPAPGTKTRYVMREANKFGNSVLVLEGLALDDSNKSWPKEAGAPDPEHVLVTADTVVRAARGDENVSLPGAFVVPVENLVA